MTMSQHLRMQSPNEICRMAAMMRFESSVKQGVTEPLPWIKLTDAQKLPWLVAAHNACSPQKTEPMVWEYPEPVMAGLPAGEDGEYPEHTPYIGFGEMGIQFVRCGGPTIE